MTNSWLLSHQAQLAGTFTRTRDHVLRYFNNSFRYATGVGHVHHGLTSFSLELQEAIDAYKTKTDEYLKRYEEAEINRAKAARAEAFGKLSLVSALCLYS